MKERNSNFELLRLLAMAMVVVGHLCMVDFRLDVHSVVCAEPWLCFLKFGLERLAGVAVDMFILISGYFCIRPKVKSIFNLFYTIVFWRFATAFGQWMCGVESADVLFSPNVLNPLNIWFVKAYLILLLLSPLLNKFVEASDKRSLLRYIGVFYLVAFISDFIIPIKFWGVFGGGYSAIWFVELYLIGRYVRLYGLGRFDFSNRKNIGLYTGLSLGAALLLWSVCLMTDVKVIFGRTACFVGYYTSPFVLLSAIALFRVFSKIQFQSRVINYLALSTFAIYLSHSPTKWFWRLANEMKALGVCEWCLCGAALVVAIFVGTILIDQVRIYSWRGLCALSRRFSAFK